MASGAVTNIAAYRFVEIGNPQAVVERIRGLCEAASLRGSVLVAPEGVNLFLAGSAADIAGFLQALGGDPRFAQLTVKSSRSHAVPFRRLRVRLKREIITFVRDADALRPKRGAPAVAPRDLLRWIRQGRDDRGRELVLLDTRNRQEVVFGTFHGALTLPIDRFTDLPGAVDRHRDELKDKAVVTFCTGGIRCEKAAPWMQSAGYGEVLQLEGGILGYFEQVGAEGFDGACFVFDERVAVDATLAAVE